VIALAAVAGSFRDPRGHVFESGDRIFRLIRKAAFDDYGFIREAKVLQRLVERGWLINSWEVDRSNFDFPDPEVVAVVEHPRLEFVSHPYEWSFALLRAAALHHLDLHLELLDHGATLSDASAYNIQFVGAKPIFIDLLSIRRYRDGEFWVGHKQFCEQFLNPLLLRAFFDIPHNAWYRGALEGIPTEELAALLPMRKRVSVRVMSHVLLPAMAHRGTRAHRPSELRKLRERKLPLRSLRSMLLQLRNWIDGLRPANTERSVWADYTRTNTYASVEQRAKRAFVAEFVAATRPCLLWDLGCNTGDYSQLALASGCRYVVGFDFDKNAIDAAYARARGENLAFLPLFLDAANPSPDQGWRNAERRGLVHRGSADALLALAFEHHLAIGRNVPLDQVVQWLVSLAPCGLIEWVEKTDSTVQCMLALREDIFNRYTLPVFEAELTRHARVVKSVTVSDEGRRLYWYERNR
jgi:ribosomal protein L11 methylase PrmA